MMPHASPYAYQVLHTLSESYEPVGDIPGQNCLLSYEQIDSHFISKQDSKRGLSYHMLSF